MRVLPETASAKSFVEKNYSAPKWAMGTISQFDAAFLFDIISKEKPINLIEIGVASGVSTVFLSRVLSALGNRAKLHSFDALDYFYADPSKKCGQYLTEAFGAMPDNVKLTTGVTSSHIARTMVHEDLFDFCFIDANHRHPWPCIDMLSIIPVTKLGAWVALHDPNLPFLHAKFPHYGPHYLLNLWPGEKLIASDHRRASGEKLLPNIGAIRLFENREDSIKAVLECMTLRWEHEIPKEHLTMAAENIELVAPTLAAPFNELVANLTNPRAVDVSEVALSGLNSWTSIMGEPWSKPFTLHANKKKAVKTCMTIRNLRARARWLVLPKITRPKDGPPLTVAVSLVETQTGRTMEKRLETSDEMPKSLVLPGDFMSSVDVSISVSIDHDDLKGAWAQFAPLYLV